MTAIITTLLWNTTEYWISMGFLCAQRRLKPRLMKTCITHCTIWQMCAVAGPQETERALAWGQSLVASGARAVWNVVTETSVVSFRGSAHKRGSGHHPCHVRGLALMKKKENKFLSSNYRSIGLMSIVSKVMKYILHNKLISLLRRNNRIRKSIYGFHNKRSWFTNQL